MSFFKLIAHLSGITRQSFNYQALKIRLKLLNSLQYSDILFNKDIQDRLGCIFKNYAQIKYVTFCTLLFCNFACSSSNILQLFEINFCRMSFVEPIQFWTLWDEIYYVGLFGKLSCCEPSNMNATCEMSFFKIVSYKWIISPLSTCSTRKMIQQSR